MSYGRQGEEREEVEVNCCHYYEALLSSKLPTLWSFVIEVQVIVYIVITMADDLQGNLQNYKLQLQQVSKAVQAVCIMCM
jgi:hypothetical protein